jgi:uncharacterized integral membrane protein
MTSRIMNNQSVTLFILTIIIVSAIATVAIVFYVMGFSNPTAWIIAGAILFGDTIAVIVILRKLIGRM